MLSLFWQITPHFEGIGAIKMVLSGFPHCRFSKKINVLGHRANLHSASQRNFSLAKISGIY